jgi:hypothetical protein
MSHQLSTGIPNLAVHFLLFTIYFLTVQFVPMLSALCAMHYALCSLPYALSQRPLFLSPGVPAVPSFYFFQSTIVNHKSSIPMRPPLNDLIFFRKYVKNLMKLAFR